MTWEREGDFLDTKYAYVCHSELNAILNSIYDCDIKLEVVGNEIFVTLDFYGSLENGHEYNLLMPQSMFVILTDDGINIGSPEIKLSRIVC